MACCSGNTIERPKGPHQGLYCSDCGKWLKWIPKKVSWKEFVMPFGKHKGKTLLKISEIDDTYLPWSVNNLTGSIRRKCIKAIIDLEGDEIE